MGKYENLGLIHSTAKKKIKINAFQRRNNEIRKQEIMRLRKWKEKKKKKSSRQKRKATFLIKENKDESHLGY
jgi:hypothetical protein